MPVVNIPATMTVLLYYVAVVFVGVWSGRKMQQWPAGLRRISRGSVLRVSRLDSRLTDEKNVYLLKLFVANRDIPLFVGFFSMTATWVGAGFLLGSAEAVYRYGLLYVQAPIGYAISLLIGGLFFAQKMRDTKSLTMIDPFQQRYGRWMGVVLSVPAVCADVFWTAATFTTLGQMAQLTLGVDGTVSIIASATATFVYTTLGSLYSVAYADVLQLAVTFCGLWVCVPFIASDKASGLIGPPKNEWSGPSRGVSALQLVDYFIMAVCGGIPWQGSQLEQPSA
ncbi:high-affinity choline transporter 1-like [Amblyomma americanum]